MLSWTRVSLSMVDFLTVLHNVFAVSWTVYWIIGSFSHGANYPMIQSSVCEWVVWKIHRVVVLCNFRTFRHSIPNISANFVTLDDDLGGVRAFLLQCSFVRSKFCMTLINESKFHLPRHFLGLGSCDMIVYFCGKSFCWRQFGNYQSMDKNFVKWSSAFEIGGNFRSAFQVCDVDNHGQYAQPCSTIFILHTIALLFIRHILASFRDVFVQSLHATEGFRWCFVEEWKFSRLSGVRILVLSFCWEFFAT